MKDCLFLWILGVVWPADVVLFMFLNLHPILNIQSFFFSFRKPKSKSQNAELYYYHKVNDKGKPASEDRSESLILLYSNLYYCRFSQFLVSSVPGGSHLVVWDRRRREEESKVELECIRQVLAYKELLVDWQGQYTCKE